MLEERIRFLEAVMKSCFSYCSIIKNKKHVVIQLVNLGIAVVT